MKTLVTINTNRIDELGQCLTVYCSNHNIHLNFLTDKKSFSVVTDNRGLVVDQVCVQSPEAVDWLIGYFTMMLVDIIVHANHDLFKKAIGLTDSVGLITIHDGQSVSTVDKRWFCRNDPENAKILKISIEELREHFQEEMK